MRPDKIPVRVGRLVVTLRVKFLNFQKTLRESGKTERNDNLWIRRGYDMNRQPTQLCPESGERQRWRGGKGHDVHTGMTHSIVAR